MAHLIVIDQIIRDAKSNLQKLSTLSCDQFYSVCWLFILRAIASDVSALVNSVDNF
jgi:hypothetical protein